MRGGGALRRRPRHLGEAQDTRASPRSRRAQLLLLALPVVVVLPGACAHRWVHEDGFINFRVVDQILSGNGPVFNEGERVEAFSSPLWLAVLLCARLTFGPLLRLEWIAVVAGVITTGAAFLLAGVAAGRVHGGRQLVLPLGLVLVSALPPVWDFATAGLEMSLVWLWLAASWWVLLVAANREKPPVGTRRFVCLGLLGLGPLVRPDLALMTAVFLGAWVVITRPSRRMLLADLGAALLVPSLYELFRMGYYASLVPNTALAKGATDHFIFLGLDYVEDLVDPYWLWIPLVPLLVALGTTLVRSAPPVKVACIAMVSAALLHAGYIVYIGGDYMHGRLLLPALFAVGLPAVVILDRAVLTGAAVALGVGWAAVCAGGIRYENVPNGAVADHRAFLRAGQRVIHPPTIGAAAEAGYDRGERGVVPALFARLNEDEPLPELPLWPAGVDEYIVVTDAIGQLGYEAGPEVHVLDQFGLAEPLTGRADVAPEDAYSRPAGHRASIASEWYAARFDIPGVRFEEELRPEALAAARLALACPPLSDLLDGVTEPLTVGRFLSNVWHSTSFTLLRVPPDPTRTVHKPCGGR